MQRLRRSWTSWSLRRLARKAVRAERRLTLLQLEVAHQALLTKELRQKEEQLRHRQAELTAQELWLRNPQQPPQPAMQLPETLLPRPLGPMPQQLRPRPLEPLSPTELQKLLTPPSTTPTGERR